MTNSLDFSTITPFKDKTEYIKFLRSLDLSKLPSENVNMITKFLEEEAIERAKEDYYAFVHLIGPTRIDGFKTGRHIELICGILQKLSRNIWKTTGYSHREMINLCPGGMKSELCTRMFAAWLLGKYPKIRLILVGYGLEFARDEFGAKILDILRSDEYQRIFPGTALREDKQTAGRFLTKGGGEMVCTSLVAKTAGRRVHLIIADDAIVEQDAYSAPVRNQLVAGYVSNIRSRLLMTPDGGELLVGTVWCDGDLFSSRVEEDATSGAPWNVTKIPAILDQESSDLLRRPSDPEGYLTVGSSFWPEFQPLTRLLSIRSSLANNISRWNAVYLQAPTPEEGIFVSPGDFNIWKENKPPKIEMVIISSDTAFTTNTWSDYTDIQIWGFFRRTPEHDEMTGTTSLVKRNCMLLGASKGKWNFPDLCDKFEELYQNHNPDFFLIENRASGLSLIPELEKRGIPVRGWKTDKDKILKAHSATPLIKSGILWVPKPIDKPNVCEKTEQWIGDVCKFPKGKHDDTPDNLFQFVLFCRDQGLLEADSYTSAGDDYEEDDEDYRNSGNGSYTAALFKRGKSYHH